MKNNTPKNDEFRFGNFYHFYIKSNYNQQKKFE